MTDFEKAKAMLAHHTCVLVKGNTVHASCKTGIAPMLDWLEQRLQLTGFSAADRIVGKAAALLFVLANVSEVYGEVMSEAGLAVLQQHHIPCTYGTLTAYIVNRRGDGMCPMEQTVLAINEPMPAFKALQEKRRQLLAGK